MATLFLNDFYTIRSKRKDPDEFHLKVLVHINRDHALFAGHFPHHPVVPGVVMIQMITEILSDSFQEELTLRELDRVKFLSLVDPTTNPFLEFELEVELQDPQGYRVNAKLMSGDQLTLKCCGKWERTKIT